jgi:hypothetical protein
VRLHQTISSGNGRRIRTPESAKIGDSIFHRQRLYEACSSMPVCRQNSATAEFPTCNKLHGPSVCDRFQMRSQFWRGTPLRSAPSSAKSLSVQSQQLLTESQVFEDEVLAGTKSADDPREEMQRNDHGKNLMGTIRIQLCAKSFILRMYDVLARHRTFLELFPMTTRQPCRRSNFLED